METHAFRHLAAMTDRYGTFEHADHAAPRREHGYCVDDMARLLLVASREPEPSPLSLELARRSLRFLADAQGTTGRTRNRRSADGRWHGRRGVEDCWGRSVWALGTAAAASTGYPADSARAYFGHAAQQRSRWPRAMAFAALGAAAVADDDPSAGAARALLADAADLLMGLGSREAAGWTWPEARLSYANAALPDALLAAGHALGRRELVERGLELLGWLLDRETRDGHLSVTPVGGAGPADDGPGFDQQPIEVATMADACARAAALTGDRRWSDGVRMAGAWFDGDNDAGAEMWDPSTGGGYDGLAADGPNRNQGTESTLALIATRQQVGHLALLGAMTTAVPVTATRQDLHLRPDPSRVVARLFVAGQEVVGGSEGRATGVVERLLALDEDEVQAGIDELLTRFGGRHRDLVSTFSHHADRISNRLDPGIELSEERWLLLGATFTHEYAVEGASLCNPSIVAHPDQTDAPLGGLRVVLSVRGIGEGHLSTVGFRTGTVTYEGLLEIDEPGPHPVLGTVDPGLLDRAAFHGHLRAAGADGESAAFVLDQLGSTFTAEELGLRLDLLADQGDTRRNARSTADSIRSIARRSYAAHFPVDADLSERVLWPATAAESHGMEDARFVRFAQPDGSTTYLATYTAFDGVDVSQQLLRTDEFVRFQSSVVSGPAARGKGLALFPRQIGGRYAALSRHDRERNSVAFSSSLDHWGTSAVVQVPHWDWELIQLGNCGSPIETEAGWLVLTHGVGPMRTYSIGALLLDLDDPTRVLSVTPEPLLSPDEDEQDGYVPNVVYTCGALLHGDALVIPYAIGDRSISVASVSCAELLGSMRPVV